MAFNPEACDKIHIRDLCLRCIVGAYQEERREKQDVVINITLYADLRPAGQSDRMEDAVDYKQTKKRIIALVENSYCFLLEKLAEQIAATCLQDPRVLRAAVTVDKPGALRFARSAAVEIIRDQPHGR
jgi:dihydroneopterin aldolase/D-erythro-7,8-dihydroneopterin triphosphate epimerase